jgi:hypothetical protein
MSAPRDGLIASLRGAEGDEAISVELQQAHTQAREIASLRSQ